MEARLKRVLIVIACIGLVSTVASADTAVERKKKLGERLDSGYTAGPSIGSDVLQTLAQVVVKKAIRSGWSELQKRLSSLSGCGETPKRMPKTCEVLKAARIEDLIASPRTLLDAFVADALVKLKSKLPLPAVAKAPAPQPPAGPPPPANAKTAGAAVTATTQVAPAAQPAPSAITAATNAEAVTTVTDDLRASLLLLVDAWTTGGIDGAVSMVKRIVKVQIKKRAAEVTCPKDKAPAVLWVLGECLLSKDADKALAFLPECPFEEHVAKCESLDDAQRAEVLHVVLIGSRALTDKKPRSSVEFFFEWAKLIDASRKELLDGLEGLFVGIVDHDWIRAVVGLGAVATTLNEAGCEEAKKCTLDRKLLKLVGAVGQFAETYVDAKNNDKTNGTAAEARQKVIEDLVASLVDRDERNHGPVISLGGSLGGFGGYRFNDNGKQYAWPLRLTLGVGLQTYHSPTAGLHLSLEAFDLGQYMTYSNSEIDVESPEVKSVVIVGGTAAVWFLNRQTPFFFGVHGSVSPFVKTMDGKLTYELGALLGVYVPLLDFN